MANVTEIDCTTGKATTRSAETPEEQAAREQAVQEHAAKQAAAAAGAATLHETIQADPAMAQETKDALCARLCPVDMAEPDAPNPVGGTAP